MKGMVALALLLVAGGIIYVMINRPAVTAKNVTGPSTSNAVFGIFGSIGSKIVSSLSSSMNNKIAPPGIVDVGGDSGTYVQGDNTVTGNTLTSDSTGNILTYGTD